MNETASTLKLKKGVLFVISAPSGAGKTSLLKELSRRVDQVSISISHTTRAKRPGEIHGQDYFFCDAAEFEKMRNNNEFLECAKVFDNDYGTAKTTVEDKLLQGSDLMLEIDWQGAQQVRAEMPDSLSVFILPPSRETLETRLRERRQDSDEVIAARMQEAIEQMSHYQQYDYVVVNDDFELALNQLASIVVSARLKLECQRAAHADLISALLEKP